MPLTHNLFTRSSRRFVAMLTVLVLLLSVLFNNPSLLWAQDDDGTLDPVCSRFAGATRYETAIAIAQNWDYARSVILARGDDFPDALAGAVLANAAEIEGPLLLTESSRLLPEVLAEIQRLGVDRIYILGGTGAVAQDVADELSSYGYMVTRLSGDSRFETAAAIAKTSVSSSEKVFLASGFSFADALSISSYAAAHHIPLLLTEAEQLPEATKQALSDLGASEVTLIGGEGVIAPAIADDLTQSGYVVSRIAGKDRYLTNIAVLTQLSFDHTSIITATGVNFPDALAGSALAAKHYNPILLVPFDESQLNSETQSYLDVYRDGAKTFYTLGGTGAVSTAMENWIQPAARPNKPLETDEIVTTDETDETTTSPPTVPANTDTGGKISLQFWDGYSNYDSYVRLLSYVPEPFTDYIDILSPSLMSWDSSAGTVTYRDKITVDIARRIVNLGQSKGARVVPFVRGDGSSIDAILQNSSKRAQLINAILKMIDDTGCDGVLVDFEMLAEASEAGLTALMRTLYETLHPQGKLVIISVMSKTSPTAEPWNSEYNYRDLAKYSDYVQVMSYDKHYTTSAPGPIAPLDWVRQVMAYSATEIPSEKILMGVPYYGRSWWWSRSYNGWLSEAFGWTIANKTARDHGVSVVRETTSTDPVGIPTFKYVDSDGDDRTAYFDDALSWGAKLDLVDEFQLGGIGGWSMGWINEISSPELYPLLKERLND